jgi:hypothetical protein
MILKFSRHFRQAARRCTHAGRARVPAAALAGTAAIHGVTWEWSENLVRGRDLGVPALITSQPRREHPPRVSAGPVGAGPAPNGMSGGKPQS